MAYARLPLDFRADPRWSSIPETHRAAAKALYVDLILYSAELLVDGQVTRPILVAFASENGVKRPTKVIEFLVSSGFLRHNNKVFSLVDWRVFHDSREDVQRRRKREADKKREQRRQLQVPDMQLAMSPDVSPRDNSGDSRERARTRAAAATAGPDSKALPNYATADPEDPIEIAAAAAPDEAPRETTIRTAAERFGANLKQLEPRARQLDTQTFALVVRTASTRIATGNVLNPAGLLIHLLDDTYKARKREHVTLTTEATLEQLALADAATCIRIGAPFAVAEQLIRTRARRRPVDDDTLTQLIDSAADHFNELVDAV